LTMFVLVYNLVRIVMLNASQQQHAPLDRISFIDALRWLRHSRSEQPHRNLLTVPIRRGRHEPRVRKRRPKEFPVMQHPRGQLRQLPPAQRDKG
jgi:hypothetical protein